MFTHVSEWRGWEVKAESSGATRCAAELFPKLLNKLVDENQFFFGLKEDPVLMETLMFKPYAASVQD